MEMESADNGKKKAFYVVNKTPPPGSGSFKNFLFNSETGEVFGRTGLSWLKITVFYIIFYFFLGLFSIALYKVFSNLTLVDDKPRWIGGDGVIGNAPGVGFRPMPDQDKNPDSTLIWINTKSELEQKYSPWADELDRFFAPYTDDSKHGEDCSYTNGKRATKENGCDVPVDKLTMCNPGSGYGYTNKEGAPCVLLKLNKIFGWKPEPYRDNFPSDMPKELQEHIKTLNAANSEQVNTTWITCEGETPADKENVGPIEYYNFGTTDKAEFGMIPNYFFPYLYQQKENYYQSPFVFIHFPAPARNVMISVECRAWDKQIVYSRQLRIGAVHFELMLD